MGLSRNCRGEVVSRCKGQRSRSLDRKTWKVFWLYVMLWPHSAYLLTLGVFQ